MYGFDVRHTPADPTPTDRIRAAVGQLSGDELSVLAMVAERLVAGRAQYGALSLQTDRRDFGQECMEEACDGLVYCAAALMRRRRNDADEGGR